MSTERRPVEPQHRRDWGCVALIAIGMIPILGAITAILIEALL